MRFLLLLLMVLTAGTADAQTTKVPTIIENVNYVLAQYGWKDRIILGSAFADGHKVSAQFVSLEDGNFVIGALKKDKKFKESNGIMLSIFHRRAQKSFREQSDPSLHIVLYENKIEIHFDLHYPGWEHPLRSYEHFREVFMNWWHRSSTCQLKVAFRLQNKH